MHIAFDHVQRVEVSHRDAGKIYAKHRVQIYHGSGKHPWDRAEDGYPPRSHDCMSEETESAETRQEAQ